MKKEKLTIVPRLQASGRMIIRVRWNGCKNEVGFATKIYAEKEKWDNDLHRAIKGTSHCVQSKKTHLQRKCTASDINACIATFKEAINEVFYSYADRNKIPTVAELKADVNKLLQRDRGVKVEKPEVNAMEKAKPETMAEIFNRFLVERGHERNWTESAKQKYRQAVRLFIKALPKVTPQNITYAHMLSFRDWLVKKRYMNRTVNKLFSVFRSFLKWVNEQDGCNVPEKVRSFCTNLKTCKKTVTYLNYDELMKLYKYDFKENKRLEFVRDMFCFTAFTSLRFDDLARLKYAYIDGDYIKMNAAKTDEPLLIFLTKDARAILEKYKDQGTPDGRVFKLYSNPHMDKLIKEVARAVGLNRIINEPYYIGTKRFEKSNPVSEVIAWHLARRTFVTCSMAMGIPEGAVRKATGHQNYATMLPYIATDVTTLKRQMTKWDGQEAKAEVYDFVDRADEATLAKMREFMRQIG